MTTADESSNGIGPMFLDMETCETLPPCPTSTSSQAASLARTSPLQARESESREAEADCGVSLTASFAWYDRESCLWRTYQHCLGGGLAEFSETWPRAGMTRSGTAYPLPPLVPHISATGFGYLPTPDASVGAFETTGMMDITSSYRKEMEGGLRPSGAKIGSSLRWCPEFIRERLRTGGEVNPEWIEVLMGFPLEWTDLKDSGTPSSPKWPGGSGDES